MALKAFKDNLSIKWTPLQDFRYAKSGAVAKEYTFSSQIVYAGVPYSNGGNGCLGMLDYYDFSTGVFYADLSVNSNKWFGSSCSGCASWGVCAVCTSVPSAYSTHDFVPKNGWFPLGNVTYPDTIPSFKDYTTEKICLENGEQTVFEGYALSDVADIVISSGEDKATAVHGMMVSIKPTVVRNADGTIDGEQSKLSICDQRAAEYPVEEDGQTVSYRGRIDHEVTFAELFKSRYIALTTAEFLGQKPYENATAQFVKDCTDIDSLYNNTIKTNYRLVSVVITVTDANGKVAYQQKEILGNQDNKNAPTTGQAMKTLVSKTKIKKACNQGETYNVVVSVLVATGDRMEIAEFQTIPNP